MVVTFSHPDYTVGSGLGLPAVTGSTACAGHGLGRCHTGKWTSPLPSVENWLVG